MDTNQITPAVTSAEGVYTAPYLRPGSYTVTAEAPGFKKLVRENINVSISQTAMVDLQLEVGGGSEQVTVTAEMPLLETATADRGNVIDQERVNELPLNGRNPFMLAKLVGGVNFNGAAIWERPFDNGAIANWSINGGRASNNEFLLDGAPNNAMAGGNNIAYVPPVDSVEEFKIQTNSYDAQYGHTGGGIINVSLKSGTNSLHGTVYEFMRRRGLDANSFQNNAQGLPRDAHYLDQFGFQVGGPVWIPKVYDGRNKSFFMFNYEGYREGTPRPQTISVPAREFLDGDFSKNVDGDGNLIPIYDPSTGHYVGDTWVRDPFQGNRIPLARINPIAKNILSFFPAPNTQTPGNDYTAGNYFFSGPDALDKDRFYNLVIKLDQQIGDKHHLFFRHASNDRTQMAYDNSNAIIGPGGNGSLPEKRINDAYVLDWVGILSPRTIANMRVSFSRYLEQDRSDANMGYDMTKLGFPSSLVSRLPGGPFFGYYSIGEYGEMGRYPEGSITNTWALAPNIARSAGAHSLKAGVDMRWIQYIVTDFGTPLNLSTDRNATQEFFDQDNNTGATAASFLLGTLTDGSSDFNQPTTNMYRYFAPWVQDDWRVTQRLSLNLGLRWDFNVPANERFNRLNRGFDLTSVSPVDAMIDRTQFPNVPTLRGGLLFAGVNGQPRNAANTYKKAIQPRIGFAYQVSSKLVVRGGWGRYYSNPSNSYLQTYGFNTSTTVTTSLDGEGRQPIENLISNLFPGPLNTPSGASLGPLTYLGNSINWVNSDFILPHVNQFSIGFQYELPGHSRLEASYVGSRSADLQSNANINTYDLAFRKQCNALEGGRSAFCDQALPNPFFGLPAFPVGTSLHDNETISRASLAIPYPQFGNLTEQMLNNGKVWYNSLQLNYEVRMRGDLNVLTNYTFSKSVDQTGEFNDYQQQILRRGISRYDRPHSITVATVYNLPFGKGKRFVNSAGGVVNRLVSGWQNTVQFRYSSGLPASLPSNVIQVANAVVPNIDWNATVIQGLSPCVAQMNGQGSINLTSNSKKAGCTSFNYLITPPYAPRFTASYTSELRLHHVPQADVSFMKITEITERMRLQFRAEAFNISNTYWHGSQQFNSTATSAAFGTMNKDAAAFTQTNQPRYIQFALKLIF